MVHNTAVAILKQYMRKVTFEKLRVLQLIAPIREEKRRQSSILLKRITRISFYK